MPARAFVRKRLRYNVARWGWAPHLAAWELWNEVDNLDGFDPAANAAWHREMARYLREIDPWHQGKATGQPVGRLLAAGIATARCRTLLS
jgi:hypothetical protein